MWHKWRPENVPKLRFIPNCGYCELISVHWFPIFYYFQCNLKATSSHTVPLINTLKTITRMKHTCSLSQVVFSSGVTPSPWTGRSLRWRWTRIPWQPSRYCTSGTWCCKPQRRPSRRSLTASDQVLYHNAIQQSPTGMIMWWIIDLQVDFFEGIW